MEDTKWLNLQNRRWTKSSDCTAEDQMQKSQLQANKMTRVLLLLLLLLQKQTTFISRSKNNFPRDFGVDSSDSESNFLQTDTKNMKTKQENYTRRSLLYESIDQIGMVKGNFAFPRRTYIPKALIMYEVAEGQVPKAIVVERLNRAYRAVDINLVLQTLGILPPAVYGETNEKFYHEKMFRNRTKIDGMEKAEYVLREGRIDENLQKVMVFASTSTRKADISPKRQGKSKAKDKQMKEKQNKSSSGSDETVIGSRITKQQFFKSRPPFEPMFPLHYFDDEEFDATKTNKILLSRTEKLEELRKVLMRARHTRMLENAGLSPAKVEATSTKMELAMLAKVVSTVPSMAHVPSHHANLLDRKSIFFQRFSSMGDVSVLTVAPIRSDSDEDLFVDLEESYAGLQYDLIELKSEYEKPCYSLDVDNDENFRQSNIFAGKLDQSEIGLDRSESLLSEVSEVSDLQ